jgi:cell division inhibitor SulA
MLALSQDSQISSAGVSEIIVPAWESASFELLLPMLSHLSRNVSDRWLTLVGGQRISKNLLEQYQFASDKVRHIPSASDKDSLWLTWESLNNGTSSFVVTNLQDSSSVKEDERALLKTAASRGNARCLVLKFPQA